MKKLLVLVSSAAVLAASLAVPAMASFDPHFRVVTKGIHAHAVAHDGTAFYEKVIDPRRPQNKVGYDHGVCRPAGPVASFCKLAFHLDGEIGGHGDIYVADKVYQGKDWLKVVGGTGAFEDVGGRVTVTQSDLGRRYGVQIFDLRP
jgi:hypothetical protein